MYMQINDKLTFRVHFVHFYFYFCRYHYFADKLIKFGLHHGDVI